MSTAREMSEAPKSEGGFSSGVVSIPLPRVFGRLHLLKLIARGGMGDVYLASTTGIEGAERACVVKTVRRDHIHDGSFLARFLDEARVQAQLCHPGVAQILEASTDENGEPFSVVEYIEGRSLADVRQRAVQLGVHIGWADAVAISIEMGQALSHVHERSAADGTPLGIVHRDLSPQNVMVGYAGEIKLIDFGTARGHNRRCHTVAGVVFAKPGYVAPEVARQQVGDGRIDVYAMGVMLWELCAGKRLLTGDPQKHLEDVAANRFTVPELAASRAIPKELDTILKKLLSNDPDERYTSASDAANDLARVLAKASGGKNGERSTRGRIATMMKALWPQEPGRGRAEFAKLLRETRTLERPSQPKTPAASAVVDRVRQAMNDDPNVLSGTPYRLIRTIGEGASGTVYEAEHVELGKKLAVKVLAPIHTSGEEAVERFRREARVLSRIEDPAFVRLLDFGRAIDGRVFIAMELLEGTPLDQRASRAMPWKKVVDIGIDVCRALEIAHEAGIVHRDLKPQNLFVTRKGTMKLLDFGVALAMTDGAEEEPRQKGFCVFGTPEYMAPEQVQGDALDGRADIYALGCVLYELATGAPPFEGDSSVVVMGKQIREAPEAPRFKVPTLPVELEEVILRALRKVPTTRFEDARTMREALERAKVLPDRKRTRGRAIVSTIAAASFGILAFAGAKQWGGPLKDRAATAIAADKEVAPVAVESLPLVTPPEKAPEPAAQVEPVAAPKIEATPTAKSTSEPVALEPVAQVTAPIVPAKAAPKAETPTVEPTKTDAPKAPEATVARATLPSLPKIVDELDLGDESAPKPAAQERPTGLVRASARDKARAEARTGHEPKKHPKPKR